MTRRFAFGFALAGALALGWSQAGVADLKTKGSGKERVLDSSQFTGKRADQHKLFISRCTTCHDQTRTLSALESGVGPSTGTKFDKDGMKAYVVGLMRKPNSGLTKEEAPEILDFLAFMREQALKAKEAIPFGPGMEKPRKKSGPDPVYTREARDAKVEGKMLVQCIVSTDGSVSSCSVLKKLPFLDKVVLEALSKQVWEPAKLDGKPITVLYTIPFVFKLKG